MKISDIDKGVGYRDFENFFDVYEDDVHVSSPYYYNLNSTLYFDGLPQEEYKLQHDMFWTTLSHEIYETTRLWWVLMKVNKVQPDDIFVPVRAGQSIRYIDKGMLNDVLVNLGEQ